MTATDEGPGQAKLAADCGAIPELRRLLPAAVLAVALVLRVLAAVVLQSFVQKLGPDRLCLFDDANYYWLLARTIREGTVYQIVEWGTISHKALRTPGYPVFLAACQTSSANGRLAVRLVQAVLGTVSVWPGLLAHPAARPELEPAFRPRRFPADRATGGRSPGSDQSLLRGHFGAAAF